MDEQNAATAPLAFLVSLAAAGDSTALASLLGELEAKLTAGAEWAVTLSPAITAEPARP